MSKVEEFYKTYKPKINTLETKDHKAFIDAIICDVAEAYHQSRVNAISDEEIMQKRKEIVNEWNKAAAGFTVCADEVFVKTIKWFKNKLLKQ